MFFCIPQGVLCYSKVPVSIVKVLKSEGTKKLNTLLLPININYASILWQYSNFLTSEMPHQNILWLMLFQKRLMVPHLPHSIFHPKINLLGEKSCWFLWRPIFSQSAYIKSVSWMNAFNSGLLLDFDQTLIAPINLSNLTWCFLRIRPSAIRLYRKTPDDSGTTLRICFVHWSFTAHQVAEEKYVRQFFASLLYPIKIEP